MTLIPVAALADLLARYRQRAVPAAAVDASTMLWNAAVSYGYQRAADELELVLLACRETLQEVEVNG